STIAPWRKRLWRWASWPIPSRLSIWETQPARVTVWCWATGPTMFAKSGKVSPYWRLRCAPWRALPEEIERPKRASLIAPCETEGEDQSRLRHFQISARAADFLIALSPWERVEGLSRGSPTDLFFARDEFAPGSELISRRDKNIRRHSNPSSPALLPNGRREI